MRLLITLDMGEMPDHVCAELSATETLRLIAANIDNFGYAYARVDKEKGVKDAGFRLCKTEKKGGGE